MNSDDVNPTKDNNKIDEETYKVIENESFD